jgi:hypothetical protein
VPAIRLAVQDGWGGIQPNFVGSVDLTVVPLGSSTTVPVTGGIGDLTGYSVGQAGTGLRLRATAPGVAPAVSEPFDIAP